ncbi:MAG: glycosyltransferase family 4 protein [Candidatus Thorarchaeota archaeon]
MKIIHVCPFIGEQLGGSERFVSNISRIQAKEHDVHIFTTTRYLNRTGISTENGVTLHRVYSPATIWNIDPLCLMIQKITNTDADIYHVHSYLYTSSFQAVLANVLRRNKVILHLHGGIGEPPYATTIIKRNVKRFYDRTLGAYTIKNSDIIASVSQKDLDYVSSRYSISDKRLRYIPNAVDTSKFYLKDNNNDGRSKVILHVGDLEPWKGLGLIHRWLQSVSESKSYNLVFKFVGQGSMLPDFIRLSDTFRKKNNGITIEMLGQRKHNEIPQIMRDSDALIMTSYWEGLPTAILEAMASGLPIISTPVGDIPRILSNNENGILINRTIESLDESISRIVEGGRELETMALKARKVVDTQFSLEHLNRVLFDLLQELHAN